MPYAGSRADRGKALALVLALHAGLGLALIAGLSVTTVREVSDAMASFDVQLPVTPPPPDPPPSRSAPAAERDAGAAGLRAKPAPVIVAPPAVPLVLPSPLPVAEKAGVEEGRDPRPGAAAGGTGPGAGGDGDGVGGAGGGGAGAGSGIGSEAQLLSGNLTRRDYRRIRRFGSPRGQAVLGITVSEQGQLIDCLTITGSGNPDLDRELCAMLRRTRWSPALDRDGLPVSVSLRYVATWDRD